MNVQARAIGSLLLVAAAAQGLTGCAARSGPLGPRSPDGLASDPAPAREQTEEAAARADHRAGRVAGYVALAVGAQATLVALVTSAMMLHQDGARADACDANKRCTQAGIDANDNLSQLGGWNAGAWALAAVGLGTGTVLVLLNPSEKRPSMRPAPGAPGDGNGKEPARPSAASGIFLGAPGGAGPGLGLRGTF
jgi:hypothetical protein